MVARAEQLGLSIAEPVAQDDADDQALMFEHIVAACRAVARDLTIEVCAKSLDAIWGDRGRPVSASVLRAGLNPSNADYKHFRLEWVIWFSHHSEHVRELLAELAGRGKPKKTADEELRDLKALLKEELPKRADAIIRKAATP